MKIALLGAKGFIGTHLCAGLRGRWDVLAWDLEEGRDVRERLREALQRGV